MAKRDQYGVHETHCNMGENLGTCKYGDDDCPMLSVDPKVHEGRPDVDPKTAKRYVERARYIPLLTEVFTKKARAYVFFYTPNWLNEERHFGAAFADEALARDFCSMMESQERNWVIVTVHPSDSWDFEQFSMGTMCTFNGGQQVTGTFIL